MLDMAATKTFAFPISVMSQHNPASQTKRLRLGEVNGKKKKNPGLLIQNPHSFYSPK